MFRGRCLWASIVITSSGVDVTCCGDAVGWVMRLIDHFGGCEDLVCRVVSVEYDAGAYFGMLVWVCVCAM